ncbi:MAG: hypothetical protein ACLPRE_07685 [Limisphaerales bacterium]
MKPIITMYPYFQTLPRGVKKMLLVSESHFFDEADTSGNQWPEKVPETAPGLHMDVTIPIQSAGHGS